MCLCELAAVCRATVNDVWCMIIRHQCSFYKQTTTLQVETNLMNSEHDKGVNFSIFQPGPQVFEFLKICPLGETTSNHDTDGPE